MKRNDQIRERSIAKRLTVILIIAIGVISIAVIGVMHVYRLGVARAELDAKADELFVYLKGILEKSLWDIDENNIHVIGAAISQNENVAALVIKDSFDQTLFKMESDQLANTIRRSGKVYHNGAVAGSVEVALTQRFYHQSNQQMLFASLITLVIALIVLVVTTGVLIRRFLKWPLDSLNEVLDAYSAGDYEPKNAIIPYREFQPFGQVLSVMGEKITQQIKTVRQAEEKYRNIFENAVEGIFQSTISGRFLSASPSMAKIYGYDTPHELISAVTNISTQCYANPEDRDEFTKRIIQDRVVQRFETQMVRRDESIIWVSLSARLVQRDHGQEPYYEGFCVDITRQKNLERQLRQAQKMEAIGTLAGGIAHDFNNILGVIIGCTELALERTSQMSEERILLEKVLGAGKRAKELVNQILTFSRQDKSELKPLFLSPIVKETLRFIRATTPATIEIKQEIDKEAGAALADPTLIHRLLMNLYTNAISAIGNKAGEMTVGLCRRKPSEIVAQEGDEVEADAYIELCVGDTGSGMTPDTVERIFDPFFTTKPVGEGTGLGLSVVHGIVKKHSGVISVESQPGQGTTFKVYFPMIDPRHIKIIDDMEPWAPTGCETILLVDDEQELLDTLKQILEELGYKIFSTTNSTEAYHRFKDTPDDFDLLITDYTMPIMTGLELATKVNLISPELPIIMCTGFRKTVDAENITSAGIGEVIFKPVDRWQLSTCIRNILDHDKKSITKQPKVQKND